MKPEEQRIAIAEACGCKRYKRRFDEKVFLCLKQPSGQWEVTTEEVEYINSDVPDYLNDLNAMHEAEKTLLPFTSQPWQGYAFWLSHLTELGGQDHAPADQRAEAFLRTLGLWTE